MVSAAVRAGKQTMVHTAEREQPVAVAMIQEWLSFSLLSLSAIFFVVDPMGAIPIFIAMTRNDPPEKRRDMARRAAIAAFFVLTTFAVAGTLIFKVFGVTLGAFKVAGGVLLLLTSIEMLRAQPQRTRVTPEETQEGFEKEDVAIFPLAIPLLAGPGSIATVTALMGRAGRKLFAVPVILSIALTCIASYLMLVAADRIARFLGVTGLNVMNRVIGLVIGALAVQFMFVGARVRVHGRPPEGGLSVEVGARAVGVGAEQRIERSASGRTQTDVWAYRSIGIEVPVIATYRVNPLFAVTAAPFLRAYWIRAWHDKIVGLTTSQAVLQWSPVLSAGFGTAAAFDLGPVQLSPGVAVERATTPGPNATTRFLFEPGVCVGTRF